MAHKAIRLPATHPVTPLPRVGLLLTALLLTAPSSVVLAQSRSSVRYDTLPGGVVRVTNSGGPEWGGGTPWRLELERVIQPPAGSPGELGNPQLRQLLDDGRLLLIDSRPAAIKLFDPAGRLVRTIGRDGEGPGEYRSPQPLLFGDSIFFHDYQLARGTIMTLTGQLVRTFPTVCCYGGFTATRDPQGRFHVVGSSPTGKAQWVIFSATGARLDSLPVPEVAPARIWEVRSGAGSSQFTVPFTAENRNWRMQDGTLMYGSTGEYRFIHSRTGRDTARIIVRERVSPIPIPSRTRDSVFESRVTGAPALRGVARKGDIPEFYPLWSDVRADGTGHLWVLTGGHDGAPHRFDIFAPDGRFLGSLASPVRAMFRTTFSSTHLAVAATDSDDLPVIRVYRIVRGTR